MKYTTNKNNHECGTITQSIEGTSISKKKRQLDSSDEYGYASGERFLFLSIESFFVMGWVLENPVVCWIKTIAFADLNNLGIAIVVYNRGRLYAMVKLRPSLFEYQLSLTPTPFEVKASTSLLHRR